MHVVLPSGVLRGTVAKLPRVSKGLSTERVTILCARLGLCSRGEAERFIRLGLVAVDGRPVHEAGALVDSNAQVSLLERGKRIQAAKVTLMLHKPVHYASCRATGGRPLARRLLDPTNRCPACKSRCDPRRMSRLDVADVLDEAASGALVFTQDGRVATRVSRDAAVEKEYVVQTLGGIVQSQLKALEEVLRAEAASHHEGMEPLGAPRPACGVGDVMEPIVRQDADDRLGVTVRGMTTCAAVKQALVLAGLRSTSLMRVRIGNLRMDGLPAGVWTVVNAANI